MVKLKLFLLLNMLNILCAGSLLSQENFDFTWDPGNIGWGMYFSPDNYDGEITFKLFDLFIEHKKTNIGLILNPVNINTCYDFSKMRMSFINFDLYWNILNKSPTILGPFISMNYLYLNQWTKLDFRDMTYKAGLKFLLRMNDFDFEKVRLLYTFHIIGTELGYRYNFYDGHSFYFNINIDLATIIYAIGLSFGSTPEGKRVKKANEDYERGIIK